MPRWACRTDPNQKDIVDALRKAGYTVTLLHQAGEGVPDLVAGRHPIMRFLEVKVPGKKLNDRQKKFHGDWKGPPIGVVTSPEEALQFLREQEITYLS